MPCFSNQLGPSLTRNCSETDQGLTGPHAAMGEHRASDAIVDRLFLSAGNRIIHAKNLCHAAPLGAEGSPSHEGKTQTRHERAVQGGMILAADIVLNQVMRDKSLEVRNTPQSTSRRQTVFPTMSFQTRLRR